MIISVLVLAAVALALLVSGQAHPVAGHAVGKTGTVFRAAEAATRDVAAAWVASQVSRTAVVACDPVMCQVLKSHGVAASGLYQLGPQTTDPLRSEVIVATATVRAQFGNLLGAVYAPAVIASFGSGRQRIDIRQTAPHGAAAFWALLRTDQANRKASGAELLHSSRIAVTATARKQLSAGLVDSRVLIAIAGMTAVHALYIVDFGNLAPGGDADLPLRFADLAAARHPDRQASRAAIAASVQSMITFLRAQGVPFRPAHMVLVSLPGGQPVLRVEFSAPSPLGLLGPRPA
jgi:hypothetical protein